MIKNKDNVAKLDKKEAVEEGVRRSLKKVNKRQRRILEMRFGINKDEQKHTLEEVGRVYGRTRERMRQF